MPDANGVRGRPHEGEADGRGSARVGGGAPAWAPCDVARRRQPDLDNRAGQRMDPRRCDAAKAGSTWRLARKSPARMSRSRESVQAGGTRTRRSARGGAGPPGPTKARRRGRRRAARREASGRCRAPDESRALLELLPARTGRRSGSRARPGSPPRPFGRSTAGGVRARGGVRRAGGVPALGDVDPIGVTSAGRGERVGAPARRGAGVGESLTRAGPATRTT